MDYLSRAQVQEICDYLSILGFPLYTFAYEEVEDNLGYIFICLLKEFTLTLYDYEMYRHFKQLFHSLAAHYKFVPGTAKAFDDYYIIDYNKLREELNKPEPE